MKSDATQQDKQANKTGTLSATTIKAFHQQADIEAFYRFVFENDLRKEALEILEKKVAEKNLLKKAKKASNSKKSLH